MESLCSSGGFKTILSLIGDKKILAVFGIIYRTCLFVRHKSLFVCHKCLFVCHNELPSYPLECLFVCHNELPSYPRS